MRDKASTMPCLAKLVGTKTQLQIFRGVDLERRPPTMSTQRRGIMKKRRKRKSPLDHAVDWCLAGKDPEHVEVKFVESPPIGNAVFAREDLDKGDFILEYAGELISLNEAECREKQYMGSKSGNFLYFFGRQCVDATLNSRTGRYVNDSPYPNSKMVPITVRNQKRLCLFALNDIKAGTEIRYDYGDVENLWWRDKNDCIHPLSWHDCIKPDKINRKGVSPSILTNKNGDISDVQVQNNQENLNASSRLQTKSENVHLNAPKSIKTNDEIQNMSKYRSKYATKIYKVKTALDGDLNEDTSEKLQNDINDKDMYGLKASFENVGDYNLGEEKTNQVKTTVDGDSSDKDTSERLQNDINDKDMHGLKASCENVGDHNLGEEKINQVKTAVDGDSSDKDTSERLQDDINDKDMHGLKASCENVGDHNLGEKKINQVKTAVDGDSSDKDTSERLQDDINDVVMNELKASCENVGDHNLGEEKTNQVKTAVDGDSSDKDTSERLQDDINDKDMHGLKASCENVGDHNLGEKKINQVKTAVDGDSSDKDTSERLQDDINDVVMNELKVSCENVGDHNLGEKKINQVKTAVDGDSSNKDTSEGLQDDINDKDMHGLKVSCENVGDHNLGEENINQVKTAVDDVDFVLHTSEKLEIDFSSSGESSNESDSNTSTVIGFSPVQEKRRQSEWKWTPYRDFVQASDSEYTVILKDPLGIFGMVKDLPTKISSPESIVSNQSPNQCDVSDDSALQVDDDVEIINTDDCSSSEGGTKVTRNKIKQKRVCGKKSKLQVMKSKSRKKKPHRPCIFCGKLDSAISRHLQTVHKDHPQIKTILLKPRKERLALLDGLKKQGIKVYNQKQLKEIKPVLLRERITKSSTDDMVMCSKCSGFYATHYFTRHKKGCTGEACPPDAISVSLISDVSDLNEEFVSKVLSKLRDDNIGNCIRNDKTLLIFGSHAYEKVKRKTGKKTEVRRSVRADMRKIANLYMQFKEERVQEIYKDVRDMLRRENFMALKRAIEIYTTKEDDSLKASLKSAMYYLLKQLANHTKAKHLIANQDSEAESISNFLCIFEMSKEMIFGDASHHTHQQRQVKLRRPAAMPLEDDLMKLREYILKRVSEITAYPELPLDSSIYVELRNCLIARLTLFNARRGGEPARLLLTEWDDAVKEAWIDHIRCEKIKDPLDLKLLNDLKITYQMGKGNYKLVPVLLPKDTIVGLHMLADCEKRKLARVAENNQYLFAATQQSENHASGWHAIDYLCAKTNLQSKELITATKQRHRVSTIFASLDLPKREREAFFEHMGHSGDINTNIYQAPPAIREVVVVGRHLTDIDKNDNENPVAHNDGYSNDCDGEDYPCGQSSNETALEESKYSLRRKDSPDLTKVAQHALSEDEITTDDNYSISENPSDSADSEKDIPILPQKREKRGRGRPRKSSIKGPPPKPVNLSAGKNFIWHTDDTQALLSEFKPFIFRTSEKTLPAKSAILNFIQERKLPLPFDKVRTKIINERTKVDNMQSRRLEMLQMK